jgi:hypothetical protein
MLVDHVGHGPWWTSHHGRYRAPPEFGHGPLRAPGDCTVAWEGGGEAEDAHWW